MEAVRLELLEQRRQRYSRGGVDVVQQQDATAFGLQPLQRPLHDGLRADVPEPVVGDHVRAPGHQRLRGEEIVRRFGAA